MEKMPEIKSVKILLVEDDKGDQKLIKTSLKNQKIKNEVVAVDNAEQALSLLAETSNSQTTDFRPDLILLDLNMPGMGGMEFLRQVKSDPQFGTIPVVILTTSDFEQDILESYKLHASGYIKKPVTLQGFQKSMSELEEYWFVICKRIPKREMSCTAK